MFLFFFQIHTKNKTIKFTKTHMAQEKIIFQRQEYDLMKKKKKIK